MRGQYLLMLALVGIHLGISALHNMAQLCAGSDHTAMPSILTRCQQLPFLSHYAQFTGIHGAYGFFGPSVGSTFHTRIEYSVDTSDEIVKLDDPGLRSTAAKLRYSSFLDLYQVYVDADTAVASLELDLANAVQQSLCRTVAARYGASRVRVSVLAKWPPALSSLRDQKSAPIRYIRLSTQTYPDESTRY